MYKFIWILDEGKFLTLAEVVLLREVVRNRKEGALKVGKKTAVRDWFVINLGLFTGLRVQEMSDLKIEDVMISKESSSLIVRNGKGGKARLVKFSREFKSVTIEYLQWKESVGESCEGGAPLIYSTNSKGSMTTRGIQKIFERNAKRAGVADHSIHHLRHTYGSHLYKESGHNLRMVQEQLGHSTITITEVYAHVLQPDLVRALNNLYG